jgi:MFS family permease
MTPSNDAAAPERRARVLIAGLFGVLTVSSGLGFYNLSLYMNVLAAARSLDVADLSAATSVYFLVGGVAGIQIGRLLQRGDARLVIVFGALLGGVALALLGQARSPLEMMVLYGLFGIGNSAVGLLPATTLVTRWFDAPRRAMALSVASTGLSLGGVVLTPLSAALFERAAVEDAMPILGLVYLLGIAPLAGWTVRSFPPTRNSAGGVVSADVTGTPYRPALRSWFFRVLTAAYVVLMASQVGGIAHLYNRGVQVAAALDAAFAVSLLAMLSITGRLLGGWLLARVPIRAFTLVNALGQAIGLLVIGLAEGRAALWLGAAVFGVTVGNLLMLQPLMLAQAFGGRDYSRIFSVSQAITTLGVAAGPLVIGLFEGAAGYRTAFAAAAAVSLVSLGLLVLAGPVPRPRSG